MKVLRFAAILASIACASAEAGFINRSDADYRLPEVTDADRAKQQNQVHTLPNVGPVDMGTRPEEPVIAHDSDGDTAMQSVQLESGKKIHGLQALRAANEDLSAGGGRPWWRLPAWALAFSVLGFATLMVFRRWADKNVPGPVRRGRG